jgi:hypothetical protein
MSPFCGRDQCACRSLCQWKCHLFVAVISVHADPFPGDAVVGGCLYLHLQAMWSLIVGTAERKLTNARNDTLLGPKPLGHA